jgi:L-threonylcarbamoyladenylate synthase
MQTIPVNDDHATQVAVTELLAGELIIVPTDTVYGLAAAAHDAEAVHRIYRAKGRPADVHLPVLASSLDQVRALGVQFSDVATALATRWWPGPLTMAFGFTPGGPRPSWLEGREEVAVRIPAYPFLLGVMEQTGVLNVTSANQHGRATPPSADEAAHALGSHVTLIIDGGTLQTTPSTLVNVRGPDALVEREGAIGHEAIRTTLESVR